MRCNIFDLCYFKNILTETLNIWTHLLGSLSFGILMICSLSTWLEEGNLLDKTVFLIFVLSAQILLFLSSFFHLVYCMSRTESEYSWFARLDYIGISILICKLLKKIRKIYLM